MLKKELLLASFLSILVLYILHLFALKLSWYFTFRWLDIPMHVLGGFWISTTALWVFLNTKRINKIADYKTKAFIVVLASVLIIGVLWEVFEIVSGNAYASYTDYWSDTSIDISSGFVGGIFAYLYFLKKKKCEYNYFRPDLKFITK